MMTKNEQILQEAEQWVAGINKHFKIKRKIIIKAGANLPLRVLARTEMFSNGHQPFIIHLSMKYFKRKGHACSLFEIIFHEMVHILIWPLVKDNKESSYRGRYEELVVWRLQSLFKKISERQ